MYISTHSLTHILKGSRCSRQNNMEALNELSLTRNDIGTVNPKS
jgi:hypothetical protein